MPQNENLPSITAMTNTSEKKREIQTIYIKYCVRFEDLFIYSVLVYILILHLGFIKLYNFIVIQTICTLYVCICEQVIPDSINI